MPQTIKEESMSDDEPILIHVDSQKMSTREKKRRRDQQVQAPPTAVKFERSPSITPGPPPTMSKKQERDEFNRSPPPSSSPPPAPPRPSKAPVSIFNKFETKAALQRKEAAAAAAASSNASSSKRSHNATASSSKSTSNLPPSSTRCVSDPSSSSSSKPPKSKTTATSSSAPKPRRSDPPASSRSKSSTKTSLVAGGSTFTKSLAERPSVASGRSVRVEGSNTARFLELEAWEAFSQFGQIETLDALITSRSNGTKDVFLTYVERSSADAAVAAINAPDFPAQAKRISLWKNLSIGKPPLKATKVVSMLFDAHVERWLKGGGGVISYAGTGIKKFIAADSSDDSSSDSDSDSDSSSESEPAPPPKKLKSSSRVEPSSTAVVSAPSTSSSKKASTNNNDMDFIPATVLRVPRSAAAPPPATQTSNVVDRKGKGREVIELLSSSDMEDSPPPPDIEEVAGMDRMSIEPTRKSKTPAPLPPSKKVINNDSSSDDDSSDSDESDAEHLSIADLFGDLPAAPPPRAPFSFMRPLQSTSMAAPAARPKRPLPRPAAAPPSVLQQLPGFPEADLSMAGLAPWKIADFQHYADWYNRCLDRRGAFVATSNIRQLHWMELQAIFLVSVTDALRIVETAKEWKEEHVQIFRKHQNANEPSQCGNCRRMFRNRWTLAHHDAAVHAKGRSRQHCAYCSFVFARRQSLILHEFEKHGVERVPIQCNLCPRILESEEALVAHQGHHQFRSRHVCEDCGELYGDKKGLAGHRHKVHRA
ncbi:hypothetical protein BDY24DRAFT_386075 [Mrakia frigida]|uniref:uncharacterized protein n=1 Tax=Mrakia frigida TaxID=29902 RepID=UPI003FCC1079